MKLTWVAPDETHGQDINSYEYRQKIGTGSFGIWSAVTNSDADTTEHTLTGLTNGTLYTYQVRALTDAGDGMESMEASAVAGPSWEFTLTRNGNAVTQLTEGSGTATAKVRIENTVRFTSDQTVTLKWGALGLDDTRLTGAGGATAITIATGAASGSSC